MITPKAKTSILTPNSTPSSSVKSNSIPDLASMEEYEEENHVPYADDRYYFPGCLRDENCGCSICLESIKATLDLMPRSAQRSSFSKLNSAAEPHRFLKKTPISIDQALLSTPTSRTRPDSDPIRVLTPIPLRSTAKSYPRQQKLELRRKGSRWDYRLLWHIFICLCVFLAGEFGVSWLGSKISKPPRLSQEIVGRLGQRSLALEDLYERIRVLEKGLQIFGLDREISRCGPKNVNWKINQDVLLLNSRCTIYKSAAEEVSIWGWPLQNAGLITAGFSSRSFTVISGRIVEWQNGGTEHLVWNASSTWMLRKWSSSAVQFDPNTWIVEYKLNILLDKPRFFSAVGNFLKFRMSIFIQRARQKFWFFPSLSCHCVPSAPRASFTSIPT